MTTPSYLGTDVELVAEATVEHHIESGTTDADGNSPCSCGKWWDSDQGPDWDQHMAEVALAALAAAGRLMPPGAKTQWGCSTPRELRFQDPVRWSTREAVLEHGNCGSCVIVSRIVTPWVETPDA